MDKTCNIDVNQIKSFIKDCRAVLEIGFGKGMFLIRSALKFPNKRFIGIESSKKLTEYVSNRINKRNLKNVMIINTPVEELFKSTASSVTFKEIYILHPDPWPKSRHAKRRTLTIGFFAAIAQYLHKEGWLYIATDYDDYFEEISENLKACKKFDFEKYPFENVPITNFSIKFTSPDKRIHSILAVHKNYKGVPKEEIEDILFTRVKDPLGGGII